MRQQNAAAELSILYVRMERANGCTTVKRWQLESTRCADRCAAQAAIKCKTLWYMHLDEILHVSPQLGVCDVVAAMCTTLDWYAMENNMPEQHVCVC